jgi:lipid-A-disaccharide synthase
MVNLIAQRRLVPELIQQDFTASGVATALAPLLVEGSPTRDAQLAGLKEIRQNLRHGKPSDQVVFPTPAPFTTRRRASILRVADAVLSFLGEPELSAESAQSRTVSEIVESTSKQ